MLTFKIAPYGMCHVTLRLPYTKAREIVRGHYPDGWQQWDGEKGRWATLMHNKLPEMVCIRLENPKNEPPYGEIFLEAELIKEGDDLLDGTILPDTLTTSTMLNIAAIIKSVLAEPGV